MNRQAYIDFRAAQEAYLKANGWGWTVTNGGTVKWNDGLCPVWQEIDDAVLRQAIRDERLMAQDFV